ncbi:MAG: hypothetical protein ACQEXJ_21090 [Myxococcota bacterium]
MCGYGSFWFKLVLGLALMGGGVFAKYKAEAATEQSPPREEEGASETSEGNADFRGWDADFDRSEDEGEGCEQETQHEAELQIGGKSIGVSCRKDWKGWRCHDASTSEMQGAIIREREPGEACLALPALPTSKEAAGPKKAAIATEFEDTAKMCASKKPLTPKAQLFLSRLVEGNWRLLINKSIVQEEDYGHAHRAVEHLCSEHPREDARLKAKAMLRELQKLAPCRTGVE